MGIGFGKLLKRFGHAQQGTVALLTGLSMLPLLAAAGCAIDFVHASSVKARLQASLDAAALAAASSGSLKEAKRRAMAEAVFAQNWQDPSTDQLPVNASFIFQGGQIAASASVEVPSSFMQLVGVTSTDVHADVTITIPEMKKAEVVLALDYSGSMKETSGGQVKYVAMRNAAIKLVDDLAEAGGNKVKFGLVPFSHHVRVTLPKSHVVGQTGGGNWTGCTQDRMYPHNVADATPAKKKDETKWGHAQAPEHIAEGCGPYGPLKLTVRPLTNDFGKITGQLSDMKPYQWTHIALGVEFGWHLLSPNAPFAEGASYGDASTEKFMIVLTDGRQTEPSFGPGGSRTEENGESNLEKLCEGAKDKGITMLTIAFDLEDESTTNRLRDCSSDPDKHFFIAEDGADIAQAFEAIKKQITAQVYVSK